MPHVYLQAFEWNLHIVRILQVKFKKMIQLIYIRLYVYKCGDEYDLLIDYIPYYMLQIVLNQRLKRV